LPTREEIRDALSLKLQELRGTENEPDAITFAGNGEPTIHPQFAGIIEDTIEVRDKYSPHTIISVLSNASMIHKNKVREALMKVDKNILKLDTGIEETFRRLNRAAGKLTLKKVVEHLQLFNGDLILQTLFVRGEYKGHFIDNTSEEEIRAWLPLVKKIRPQYVMIYPIDRGTPVKTLEKIPKSELQNIARQLEDAGIKTEVYF
jgi:wyosine [tRNA(Phe)-imidazoG37] synthetase (radical SAM superfamily)